jgi:hypothetical protein
MRGPCSFPGCVRDNRVRGLCGSHYRQQRLGRPLTPLIGTDANIEARLWAGTRKDEGCWEWTGLCNHKGYGFMSMRGKLVSVHRVSWWLHNGPVLGGPFCLPPLRQSRVCQARSSLPWNARGQHARLRLEGSPKQPWRAQPIREAHRRGRARYSSPITS